MHKPDANKDIGREMAALFATAEAPPDSDRQFAAEVITRIRRRERMRWWILGGSALLASAIGLPAVWELLTAWNGVAPNLMDGVAPSLKDGLAGLSSGLDQAAALGAGFLSAAVRSITFLTAAGLAVTIFPLLHWLAD